MNDVLELLVSFSMVLFALVVVWFLAVESFPYVAILLAIYSCWVVYRWFSRRQDRKGVQ
jgi:Ca2+-dependent lipid-binding protein